MCQTPLSALYKLSNLESSQQNQELSTVTSLTSLWMRKLRKLYKVPHVIIDGAKKAPSVRVRALTHYVILFIKMEESSSSN